MKTEKKGKSDSDDEVLLFGYEPERKANSKHNHPFIPDEDIDKMIAEIDRKIAELEEEERVENEQKMKRMNFDGGIRDGKGKNANSRKNKHELKDDDSGDSEKS